MAFESIRPLEKLINPPLLNSANPWATSEADLEALHDCPYTGAVTTRTSLLSGFAHDDSVHQYAFFESDTARTVETAHTTPLSSLSSLNTLGYSPLPLQSYLDFLTKLVERAECKSKPFVVSVTGTPTQVVECFRLISSCAKRSCSPMLMEINLSCPNILGRSPPAYDGSALGEYLDALRNSEPCLCRDVSEPGEMSRIETGRRVLVGIKTPPYTYDAQFKTLIAALLSSVAGEMCCPINFITATNTLGSSLILDHRKSEHGWSATLPSAAGTGIGGLAGAALHPLALGNVATLRRLLDDATLDGDARPLAQIELIGTGGVSSADGYERMRTVGAACVGVGTALGVRGVNCFQEIIGSYKG